MTFSQQLTQFVANHWALVGGFILLFILLLLDEARSKGLGQQLNVHAVVALMNREGAVILDIRDEEAFNAAHIAGAHHIPSLEIDQNISKIKAFKASHHIVVCQRGQSAMAVAAKLSKQGLEKVEVLKGGMTAWNNASMPTKTK